MVSYGSSLACLLVYKVVAQTNIILQCLGVDMRTGSVVLSIVSLCGMPINSDFEVWC